MSANETTEVVFTGRRLRVERRHVVLRERRCTFEVVVAPEAAVVLPVLDDGRVVLIHNHRVAVGRELLEAPAGILDPGETPERCAARELAEETGYRAGRLVPLMSLYPSPGILTEKLHAFAAFGLEPGPTAHEPGEQIRLAPMMLVEALEAVGDGRICDAKTVAVLLYFDRFHGRTGGRK